MRANSPTRWIVAIAVVAALSACADDASVGQDRDRDPSSSRASTADDVDDVSDDSSVTTTAAADSDVLDPDEVAGLLWMREEEQLAHDVYVVLGDEWGTRVFENIAASEQQHIELTLGLLDRYDLDDIAAGNESGQFTDPRIQQLYDDLVEQGMTSQVAALTVGATIEELDIADLRARAAATDEAPILDVYARLERASRNHLRAFVGRLEMLGADYAPTVLADFAEIVDSPMERGGGAPGEH